MKTIAGVVIFIYALTTLGYWASIWGGIGFFGAIITFPVSVILAWILSFFKGWWLWNLVALFAGFIVIGDD